MWRRSSWSTRSRRFMRLKKTQTERERGKGREGKDEQKSVTMALYHIVWSLIQQSNESWVRACEVHEGSDYSYRCVMGKSIWINHSRSMSRCLHAGQKGSPDALRSLTMTCYYFWQTLQLPDLNPAESNAGYLEVNCETPSNNNKKRNCCYYCLYFLSMESCVRQQRKNVTVSLVDVIKLLVLSIQNQKILRFRERATIHSTSSEILAFLLRVATAFNSPIWKLSKKRE